MEQEQEVRFEEFVEQNWIQFRELEEALEQTLSESAHPLTDPIVLDLAPKESTTLIDLVKTDNKLFDKTILMFSSLIVEMKKLAHLAATRYTQPLLLFGTDESSPEAVAEGDAQIRVGRMIEFLVELRAFLQRCYTVTRNVIRQLASLYHREQTMYRQSFHSFKMSSVWAALGELFAALMALDEVVRSNDSFAQCWAMYKRMTLAIRSEPGRYGVEENEVFQFEKLLQQLSTSLLEGFIFGFAIDQEFDFPGLVSVQKNTVFREEFVTYIKSEIVALTEMYAKGAPPTVERRICHPAPHRYMALCGLYACYFTIFQAATDKKLFHTIWEFHKVFPIVHLVGDVVWTSPDFLAKKIMLLVPTLPKEDTSGYRLEYIKRWQQRFPSEVQQILAETYTWMVRMESNLTNRMESSQSSHFTMLIDTRIVLLTEGIRLLHRITELFNLYTVFHTKMRIPIRGSDVPLLNRLVELIKGIQLTFFRREAIIGESLSFMISRLSYAIQNALLPLNRRLVTIDQKQLSPQRLDVIAAVSCALSMLNSPGTHLRRAVLKLCTHLIFPYSAEFWKPQQIEEIRLQMDKLDLVASFQELLLKYSNCSFLFWNQTFLPIYFSAFKFKPADCHRMQYMLYALRDVETLLGASIHEPAAKLQEEFRNNIRLMIDNEVIKPVQTAIENDLRFHVHCHLKVQVRDPFKQGIVNHRPFLDLPPLRFFSSYLSIREAVTHYLDTVFYNLNTVQLSDWKTYGEMRNLAKEKYGLELTDVHLPGQTLEQGLDVLEIMRAIHLFVARFSYNLNNQIFLERSSESKFLHTINIQHIANSIRTHGTGIMNTAVNFIFQFLKRKFNIFSQFLFDDYIKSHLYRDVRYFKDHRTELENMYSYERAELFNRDIRKLGTNDKNQTYMDQFRGLITEIGNAMGYVRMIRSAGMLYTSNAIKFVPDLKHIPKFAEEAQASGLPEATVQAAKNLDSTLDTLSKNFAEGTDYFQSLVAVFCNQFRDEKNIHLHNFYIIVPPLTINFVEHSLQMKEKLAKKKLNGGIHEGANFTDDGFAIGLAYILKLLDQNTAFNSLHWFDAVALRYKTEIQKVEDGLAKAVASQKGKRNPDSSREAEVSQSLILTTKKLRSYQFEFQLLRYAFEGARIFFKE